MSVHSLYSLVTNRWFTVCVHVHALKESQKTGSGIKGKLGVAPLPGSTQVFDRADRALKPCSPELCPTAEPFSDHISGNTLYLNRAPFTPGGGWVASVNARSRVDYLNFTLAFFSRLAGPEEAWIRVLDPDLGETREWDHAICSF